MRKVLSHIFFICVTCSCFLLFSYTGEKVLYPVYSQLYEYRRLTPELLPSEKSLKILSIGHDTTYADMLWVSLIQFIGDNIGNNKYLDFSHHILSSITSLHPFFPRAYELDLIYTPLVFADSGDKTTDDDREKTLRAISHGKEGMDRYCDQEKIRRISDIPYGSNLWSRNDLRNPCRVGMLPYYIGFHYANDFEDGEKASYYYKIASMQDDAPSATKFLGPIALARASNPRDAILSFLYIARDGYDVEPFECQKMTNELISDITTDRVIDQVWVDTVRKKELGLHDPKGSTSIDAYASNNCYESLLRGIKQFYVAYITEKAKESPDINDARELVKLGKIPYIPTLSSQSGFTLRKRDGKWMFRNY